MMRTAALLAALATVAAGSWLGDEYWTLIGHSGRPIQGDAANFARVAHYFKPDEHNRYVAFWMTNTHYAGRMFEQFGEAFKKEEGEEDKYCARFTGERGEAVEVCENFRILTVPERYRSRTIFEWVKIDSIDGLETDKIGYNDHRICAFAYDPSETAAGVKYSDFTFGDAVPSKNVANAVNKLNRKPSSNFDNYLLRLLVDESLAQQSIPRLPSPPGHEHHTAHRQHTERRENVAHMQHQQGQQQAQEQQAQQDAEYARRLAEYNERLRQQQAQQQRERDHYDAQQQQVHVQANVQQVQQPQQQGSEHPLRHICDTYGRVFELTKGEDGRTRYVTYDLSAHGGVRPPCTLIGETPGQSVRVERGEEVPGQRPYPVRRSCSGSRKKKDAEEDC